MRPSKKQIMDANRFKSELVALSKKADAIANRCDYEAWKETVDRRIAEINSRIRSVPLLNSHRRTCD